MRDLSNARSCAVLSLGERYNAIRQNHDVASLADMSADRAMPWYTDKAEESRKFLGENEMGPWRARQRNLTRDPERSLRRQTRGVSSKKPAGRRLMILARSSKKGGYRRGSEERWGIQIEKKRWGRTCRFLPFAHTNSRVFSRALLCREVRSRACVSTEDETKRVHPGVTYNAPWYRSK